MYTNKKNWTPGENVGRCGSISEGAIKMAAIASAQSSHESYS